MARHLHAPAPPLLPSWPLRVLTVLVVFRAAMITLATLSGRWMTERPFPIWISFLQVLVFAGPAIFLLISGRDDRRAWSLGTYFLDVACTIGEPYVRFWPEQMFVVSAALSIRTDAFQGAMLTFFAAEFPQAPSSTRLSMLYRTVFAASLIIGAILVLSEALGPMGGLSRESAGWYFGVQYLLLPALATAWLLKLRTLTLADRRRAYLLVGALVAAVSAVTVVVLSEGYFNFELQPGSAAAWAALFTIAVGILPVSATYAALVQRVLPVSVILRAAAQYLLSRVMLNIAATVPILILIGYAAANRERSISEVFTGVTGTILLGIAVIGIVLSATRKTLLARIDHRFGRQQVQSSGPLLDLAGILRRIDTTDDFAEVLSTALNAVFQPRSLLIALADARGHLHAQHHPLAPLARESALAQLIGSSDEPLIVSLDASSVLARLTPGERHWLFESGAALLGPMRSAGGELLGVIAIGERRSELPYSDQDRRDLEAIGSMCGLALYRLRTKDSSSGALVDPDEPARECVECGLLHSTDTSACRCGAPLQLAPVPLRLRDDLRFVRRLGAGAMGVVYEARDSAVHQPRAVKALPEMDAVLMTRLRREAKTMAAVSHPNLATFYALSTWRAAPLLVMEFCGRGTLADQLRRGALPIEQAFGIAERIADALGYLHAHGIVHRDVKPSNIGFTDEMAPKLLDFGLAKLLDASLLRPAANDASTFSVSMSDSEGAIRGTPPYLSPEVLGGAAPSAADDLWSLSVTLLESCTGVNPFRASTPAASAARVMIDDGRVSASVSGLPQPAAGILSGLLERQPGRRPSTALEFQRQMRLILHGAPHG